MVIRAAVEGDVDEAVVRKLIEHIGGVLGEVYGKKGKPLLRQRIAGYNNAARHSPWIVLVDLDRDEDCAPLLRDAWLRYPAPHLCFRIAVRAIEAWLLADKDTLAAFLGVARRKIPANPEMLDSPKQTLVNLARTAKRRALQEDIVPREGSGRSVGPAYSSRLIEYVRSHWRPEVAVKHSDSLRRAIECLQRLANPA